MLPLTRRSLHTLRPLKPSPNAQNAPLRQTIPPIRRPLTTPSTPPMTRLANRPLPPLPTSPLRKWALTLPLFALIMTASTLAIFNYQKTSSSVVHSTLYSLRTNPLAREMLGEEIYFASQVPWISGKIDTVHGKVDVGFWVKGSRGKGWMRFWSERVGGGMGGFVTKEWSLKMDGGEEVVDLRVGEELKR